MKPFKKVAAFLLAVVMIVIASGCTPMSLSKEWSYKDADTELAIGVYIYSLYQAYSEASNYAKDNKDFDSTKSFMDLEITDDDGNTKVAREWIKEQADKITKNLLAINYQLKELNVTVDQATLDEAKSAAQTVWDVGQYASYGYFSPMSKILEPYGISFDSFFVSTYEAMAKQDALFNAIYGKGGSQEVADSDLTSYFTDNYTDYKYFSAALSTSTTDESGNSTSKAMTDEEKEKVRDELQGYANALNSKSKTFDEVLKTYMDANAITTDPSKSGVENLENSTIGDELKEKLKDMEQGKADVIEIGTGDTAQCYLVYKGKINDDVKTYIDDKTNRASVLSAMKSDDFNDFLEKSLENLKVEINTAQIDRYDPNMFFVPEEPTTAAATAAQS